MSIEVTISKVCQSNQTIIYTLAGTPLLLITDATQLASLQRLVLYILPFLPFHHYPPTHMNNPSKHQHLCKMLNARSHCFFTFSFFLFSPSNFILYLFLFPFSCDKHRFLSLYLSLSLYSSSNVLLSTIIAGS
jgi:hypothetical protein